VTRLATVIAIALALLLGTNTVALAHATLVRGEPVAGSRLGVSPRRVLLVFSEPLEPGLARLSLEDGAGHVIPLAASGDPHDVHAILGPIGRLSAGSYRVNWRVVSADGHPVQGSFVFTVGAATAAAPPPPAPVAADSATTWGPTVIGAPLILAALRAAALGALLSLAGLLFFVSSAPAAMRARRLARWLAFAAPLLLALHHAAWMMNAVPSHRLTSETMAAAMASSVGQVELWRTALALLALWAFVLARRPRLALFFALAAVVVSGATGHAAAIHAFWATPAKAVHLVAAAAWIGGLLWLLTADRRDTAAFIDSATRVSRVALAAVLLVTASGVVQTLLFLATPLDLFRTAYGVLVLAKVAGLVALIAFGAHHRYRALPALERDAASSHTMAVTLRREVALMAIVVAVGALLAYVPPSVSPASQSDPHSMSLP
jgi:copper transport protein